MTALTSPCQGCPKRRPATETTNSCHSECERYRAYDAEKQAERAERFAGHVSRLSRVEWLKRKPRAQKRSER